MVSEADGFKGLRAKAIAHADAGGPPTILRPKRKRAFYRGLKRGEGWAQYEHSSQNMMKIIANLALNEMLQEMLQPSPFLKFFKKEKE